MRVLIVAAAVLACAAAVPSGLLAGPYAHGLGLGHGLGLAHGSPLGLAAPLAAHAPVALAHGPALPTISPGDIAAAAIDSHVDAHDHARAAVDAVRGAHDQAAELQGQAINAAEDHSWQAVDAVKTAEAQLDGAAAGVAPVLAKQLVGHAAPVHAAYSAPLYGAAPIHAAYSAPLAAGYASYGAHAAYAAPALAASKTVVSQSLSQTHPGAIVHAAPLVAHGAPLGYAGYAHGGIAHAGLSHGLAHGW